MERFGETIAGALIIGIILRSRVSYLSHYDTGDTSTYNTIIKSMNHLDSGSSTFLGAFLALLEKSSNQSSSSLGSNIPGQ